MIENLTPEAERRMVLKSLVLTETELSQYRKLHPDDARWRIEHEHKIQREWLDRRRDFMLADCVAPTPKKPRKPPTNGAIIVVRRHASVAVGISGAKIG